MISPLFLIFTYGIILYSVFPAEIKASFQFPNANFTPLLTANNNTPYSISILLDSKIKSNRIYFLSSNLNIGEVIQDIDNFLHLTIIDCTNTTLIQFRNFLNLSSKVGNYSNFLSSKILQLEPFAIFINYS